jgi:hypothetical protein
MVAMVAMAAVVAMVAMVEVAGALPKMPKMQTKTRNKCAPFAGVARRTVSFSIAGTLCSAGTAVAMSFGPGIASDGANSRSSFLAAVGLCAKNPNIQHSSNQKTKKQKVFFFGL